MNSNLIQLGYVFSLGPWLKKRCKISDRWFVTVKNKLFLYKIKMRQIVEKKITYQQEDNNLFC